LPYPAISTRPNNHEGTVIKQKAEVGTSILISFFKYHVESFLPFFNLSRKARISTVGLKEIARSKRQDHEESHGVIEKLQAPLSQSFQSLITVPNQYWSKRSKGIPTTMLAFPVGKPRVDKD
jgi:hypothetical protein